jgi:hypothetical protein
MGNFLSDARRGVSDFLIDCDDDDGDDGGDDDDVDDDVDDDDGDDDGKDEDAEPFVIDCEASETEFGEFEEVIDVSMVIARAS